MNPSNDCTLGVLKKFGDALKCKICNNITKKPFTTGTCSHFFCQACLLGLDESICPSCSQPFYPGDITPDTTVGSILQEINTISKVFESSRAPAVSLLDEVLGDIENGESKPNEGSYKIAERANKKGSIYTKKSKLSSSVKNSPQTLKPTSSAAESPKDVNENSPIFANNEIESVDMIGNSQSPIKKTPLCFAKQKPTRQALNDVNKGRGGGGKVVLSERLSRENDFQSPDKSSDSELEFTGFPLVLVKNQAPTEKGNVNGKQKCDNSDGLERKQSLNGNDVKSNENLESKPNNARKIKRDNSIGLRRKQSLNGNDEKSDDNLESKSSNARKIKRMDKIKESNNDVPKDRCGSFVPVKSKKRTSDEKLEVNNGGGSEKMERKPSLNEENVGNFVRNKKKMKKNETCSEPNENSPLDSSVNVKKIKRSCVLGDANESISKVKDGAKKPTSLIQMRNDHSKELRKVSEMESDSCEIIPATPLDSVQAKGVGPISARGKRQKQDGGKKSLNTSLNINSTKRRDSVKLNKKGETPLQVACAKANVAEVERLLKEDADPNTKDYAGWTPLHEAVMKGNIQIVEALVKAGANINTPGHLNVTPLLEAVLQNNYVMVSFLLRNGADRSLRSRYNYRPLDCAQGEDMIKLLNQVHPLDSLTKREASTNFTMPEPFCLCPISLNAEQSQTLRDFCIKFELKCVQSLRSDVTHAIVVTQDNVCKCDLNVLKCLANGIAVISFNWIEHSLQSDVMTKPDVWEVHGTEDFPNSEAFMKSRINAQKLLPKLFDGLHVSFTSCFTVWKEMKKCEVMDLMRDAGAVVLNREPAPESIPDAEKTCMFHAKSDGPMGICSHVTLYVPGVREPLLKYNMKHLKTLSVKWVTDCLQCFNIIDPILHLVMSYSFEYAHTFKSSSNLQPTKAGGEFLAFVSQLYWLLLYV